MYTARKRDNPTRELSLLDGTMRYPSSTSVAKTFSNRADFACVQLFCFNHNSIMRITALIS